MNRFKASLIHLLISALLVGCVFAVVYWVWYPKPAFEVVGTSSIIRLLVFVDLVMGPLLTFVVYKQGKPGLRFDLSVIVLMQIVALIYGSYRLYEERPYYLVFAVDRVEFIPKKLIDQSEIRYEELRSKSLTKLVHVFARRPEDADALQAYRNSVMVDGKPDLERRPEYWEPWAAGADVIRGQLTAIGDISPASAEEQKSADQALKDYGPTHPNLGVIPIGGIAEDLSMLLDRDTLEVLDVVDVNSWGSTNP